MKLLKVTIESDSKAHSRVLDGFVIRETNTTRLFYVPEIVDNPSDQNLSVRGKLIYQKRNEQDWTDNVNLKLSTLKKGEWTSFDIKSEELFELSNISNHLKQIYEKDGIPYGSNEYLFLQSEADDFFNEGITLEDFANVLINFEKRVEIVKLIKYINEHSKDKEDILDIINELLPEISNVNTNDFSKLNDYIKYKSEIDGILGQLNEDSLHKINFKIKQYSIERILMKMKNMLSNSAESDWQTFFIDNSFILPMLIPTTSHTIGDNRFTGGTKVNGKGFSIADFLLKWDNNIVSIVEIKKPNTKLIIKKEYRIDVYAPSWDLSGAIVKLINKGMI
jgi:hypothetical protein